MRAPGNPTAATPLIRCPSPSPIHTLRVVRREPAYMGESDARDDMDGARGGGRDDRLQRRSGHRARPLATVYSATGRIGATVSQFRAILGAPNGGIAGEH